MSASSSIEAAEDVPKGSRLPQLTNEDFSIALMRLVVQAQNPSAQVRRRHASPLLSHPSRLPVTPSQLYTASRMPTTEHILPMRPGGHCHCLGRSQP